jgi:uncharacterized phage-like protein YoqJ
MGDEMDKTEKTVMFTGHRSQNLPFGFDETNPKCIKMKEIIKTQICELIENEFAIKFISGMAIGVDMICAEIVLELKKEYANITLECAIPCESQPDRWSESFKQRYYNILNECDKKTILQKDYTNDCMYKRNEYMVDNSDIVMAVWNGKKSGTSYTVEYAQKKGRRVLVLNPDKL